MSRIEELMGELAPNGVPTIALDRLFETRNGYTPAKSDSSLWADGTIPWFRMEDIRENGRILGSAIQSVAPAAVKGGRLFPANSILVATSATIGEHALVTVPHLSNQRFTSLSIRPELAADFDIKFLYHYCFLLGEWCRNNTTVSSFASVDMTGFRAFSFPVPPLEVQLEVVKILDQFAKLEAELEADLEGELEARTVQFAQGRDTVLSFDATVPMVPIGALAGDGFLRDGDWVESKDQDSSGSVRLTQLADVGVGVFRDRSDRWMREDQAARLSCTLLEPGDILIARMPDPIGRACQVPSEVGRAVTVVDVAILRSRHTGVLPRYVMYSINSTQSKRQMVAHQAGVTRKRITRMNLAAVRLPIPSTDEQASVIALLDEFAALTSELTIELHAELAARRQQHEYYRNELLSFAPSTA